MGLIRYPIHDSYYYYHPVSRPQLSASNIAFLRSLGLVVLQS